MRKLTLIAITLIIGFNVFGQSIPSKEMKKNIDAVFQSYANYNRFIGNVLISQGDNIIYEKSFGYADIESHRKNKRNSIFRIASSTKPLTAVGIMKLIEDGRLTLETPISNYFPNFIPDLSKDITIRHLLNHSSGMQANIGRTDDEGNGLMPDKNPITLDELLSKFKNSKLKFAPGTRYEYNNFGYTLLAYIIEKVSEKTYADYMEQAVFKPAKMRNTSVDTYTSTNKKAFSHIGLGMNSIKKHKSEIHYSWLKGAGNIISNTPDLSNFMIALQNDKLLKKSSVDMLYSLTQKITGNISEYGLGWRIESRGNEKWINHTGLLPGYASIMGSLPKRDLNIIILSNATSTDLMTETDFQGKSQFVDAEIIDNVIAVLQGENAELLPTPIKIDKKNSVDYSRTYKMDNTHSLVLTKKEGNYTLKTTGSESWSVFTYPFSRDVKEETKPRKIGLFFAKAMSTQNFNGLTKYGNKDMKSFLGSEEGINQLKGMWTYFEKQAGEFLSYNIYKIAGINSKSVHIRFHFKNNDIGFVLAINSENLIQGMFMDDAIKTSHVSQVSLIATGKDTFFINGHQNEGMQDLKIKITKKGLVLIDDNLNFKAIRLQKNK